MITPEGFWKDKEKQIKKMDKTLNNEETETPLNEKIIKKVLKETIDKFGFIEDYGCDDDWDKEFRFAIQKALTLSHEEEIKFLKKIEEDWADWTYKNSLDIIKQRIYSLEKTGEKEKSGLTLEQEDKIRWKGDVY